VGCSHKVDVEALKHLELAERFLEEGKVLTDKDSIQASEKLYKAAEEVVKALAAHYSLGNILKIVEKRGRWTVAELEEAVELISQRVSEWFITSWDSAWALHVWGFHEAKLDSKAVKIRVPYIERMVLEAKKVIRGDTR
jgi:hypothetical protein